MELLDEPLERKWLVAASLATLAVSIVAVIAIPGALRGIFSSQFLPHAYCYLYDKSLIGLHVGADLAIWLSYVAISITLTYLVYRTRREIPFSWMLLAFGTFIIACGFTHFMEILVLWKPLYWLAGDVKLLTAVASVITAIALPPLVPRAHEMLRSAKLSGERKQQLETANRELSGLNVALEQEVERRTRVERELRRLSGQLLRLQDEERRRLARELHDSTGQLLAALQLNLGVIEQNDPNLAPGSARRVKDAMALADQAISEVRTISYLLHPPMLDEAGLDVALGWYVDGFAERSKVQVSLSLPEHMQRLSHDLELALFRVVQEALTNIHRHSGSSRASIELRLEGDKICLRIADEGKGLPPEKLEDSRDGAKSFGVGIRGMKERVRQLRGTFTIIPGHPGTVIEVELPLETAKDREANMAVGPGV
jgi:signal transduction histidine kinase